MPWNAGKATSGRSGSRLGGRGEKGRGRAGRGAHHQQWRGHGRLDDARKQWEEGRTAAENEAEEELDHGDATIADAEDSGPIPPAWPPEAEQLQTAVTTPAAKAPITKRPSAGPPKAKSNFTTAVRGRREPDAMVEAHEGEEDIGANASPSKRLRSEPKFRHPNPPKSTPPKVAPPMEGLNENEDDHMELVDEDSVAVHRVSRPIAAAKHFVAAPKKGLASSFTPPAPPKAKGKPSSLGASAKASAEASSPPSSGAALAPPKPPVPVQKLPATSPKPYTTPPKPAAAIQKLPAASPRPPTAPPDLPAVSSTPAAAPAKPPSAAQKLPAVGATAASCLRPTVPPAKKAPPVPPRGQAVGAVSPSPQETPPPKIKGAWSLKGAVEKKGKGATRQPRDLGKGTQLGWRWQDAPDEGVDATEAPTEDEQTYDEEALMYDDSTYGGTSSWPSRSNQTEDRPPPGSQSPPDNHVAPKQQRRGFANSGKNFDVTQLIQLPDNGNSFADATGEEAIAWPLEDGDGVVVDGANWLHEGSWADDRRQVDSANWLHDGDQTDDRMEPQDGWPDSSWREEMDVPASMPEDFGAGDAAEEGGGEGEGEGAGAQQAYQSHPTPTLLDSANSWEHEEIDIEQDFPSTFQPDQPPTTPAVGNGVHVPPPDRVGSANAEAYSWLHADAPAPQALSWMQDEHLEDAEPVGMKPSPPESPVAAEDISGIFDEADNFHWPEIGTASPVSVAAAAADSATAALEAALRRLPAEAYKACGESRPTEASVRALCACLSRNDLNPPGLVVPLLRQLYSWLWSGFQEQVQQWLLGDASTISAIVALLAAPLPLGRASAFWACHVLGRACAGHVLNSTAFADAGAIDAICQLVDARPHDAEVHCAAVAALSYLGLGDAALRQRVVRAGAVGRLLRTVEAYEVDLR